MQGIEGDSGKKTEEPMFRSLEFNFSEWNIGGKLIFIATVIAIVSLLFTWIDSSDQSEIGFLQGGSIFLAAYIYPFFILAQDKRMNKIIAGISAGLAVVLPLIFLNYMSGRIRESMMDIMGIGLLIFIIGGILLLIGVTKYKRYDRYSSTEKEGIERGKPCPTCDKPMDYEGKWNRWFCENCEEYK